MTTNEYKWLFQDSPSLLLLLDETLVCQSIAAAWRDRLASALAKTPARQF